MIIISLIESAERFQSGQVGIIPTDTVYGLATVASNESSVERFYSLKARVKKPGTLIAASTDQLLELGFNPDDIGKVQKYWPGAVSVVLTLSSNAYLTQGVGSLAVRVVDKPELAQLLQITGPLITSSANQPSQTPARSVAEAHGYFGDDVDFYVDGGVIPENLPSTIIKITDGKIELIRQGAVDLSPNLDITGV